MSIIVTHCFRWVVGNNCVDGTRGSVIVYSAADVLWVCGAWDEKIDGVCEM